MSRVIGTVARISHRPAFLQPCQTRPTGQDAQLTVLHVVPTFDPVQVCAELGAPVQIIDPVPREEVLREMRRLLDRAGFSADVTWRRGRRRLNVNRRSGR